MIVLVLLVAGCDDHEEKPGPVFDKQREEKLEQHKVLVHHPSFGKGKQQELTLTRRLDGNGFPVEYGMWVDSVYCADGRCEVIDVKMYWDALGRFSRYELPPGKVLTKSDHVPFTKTDYAKLDALLKDRNSILRTHSLKSLTRPVKTKKKDVDAVSQATEMSVRNAVVKGATYTSYNLWHWANGDMVGAIEELTHQNCSKALLMHFLHSKHQHEVLFGIEHLRQHKIFDSNTVAAVMAVMRDGDDDRMVAGVTYLRAAFPDPAAFYKHMGRLFSDSNRRGQLHLLNLFAQEAKLPKALYQHLAMQIQHCEEYFELHLLLNLLEKGSYTSETVLTNTAKVLNHKNFFMARRAFWFLQKKELSPELKQKLKAFQEKHKDRL